MPAPYIRQELKAILLIDFYVQDNYIRHKKINFLQQLITCCHCKNIMPHIRNHLNAIPYFQHAKDVVGFKLFAKLSVSSVSSPFMLSTSEKASTMIPIRVATNSLPDFRYIW